MYFSLEKLLDYKGNRYEFAKACMEYAKKVRMLGTKEYIEAGEKEALVSIRALLEGEIKFARSEAEMEEVDEDMGDFLERHSSSRE